MHHLSVFYQQYTLEILPYPIKRDFLFVWRLISSGRKFGIQILLRNMILVMVKLYSVCQKANYKIHTHFSDKLWRKYTLRRMNLVHADTMNQCTSRHLTTAQLLLEVIFIEIIFALVRFIRSNRCSYFGRSIYLLLRPAKVPNKTNK